MKGLEGDAIISFGTLFLNVLLSSTTSFFSSSTGFKYYKMIYQNNFFDKFT